MSTDRRDVARMLASYSRRTLEGWATARGLDPKELRGNALQQDLAGLLLAPSFLKKALVEASPGERLVLARLKLEGGRLPPEELKAQLVVDGMADPDAALTALMTRGLLFYDRSMEHYGYGRWEVWGTTHQQFYGAVPALWLPGEILDLVKVPEDLGHVPLEPAPEPQQVREVPFATLQRDIYLLLQALRAQPVKLLKSGEVGKRESTRLLQILPKGGAGEGDPTTGARTKDDWFEFLWVLLQRAGLIAIEAGQVIATDAGLRFLCQSEAEQAQILYRAWLNLPEWNEFFRVPTLEFEHSGFHDFPHPTHLQAARLTVGDLLMRQEAYPGWYTVASLIESVKRFRVAFLIFRSNTARYIAWDFGSSQKDDRRYRGIYEAGSKPRRYFNKDTDWDLVEGGYLRTLLEETLAWLGIVRLGYVDGKLVSFQLTERGAYALGLLQELPTAIQEPGAGTRAAGSRRGKSQEPTKRALVVQPNFEVVVYQEVAGVPVLLELDRFAERLRMDRAAIYRLTRAALCRGLQSGLSLDEILGTLEQHNGAPLPQNVAYTLEEWRQLYERIQVRRSVTLIEAADDREFQELRRLPELAVAREVAPRVLLAPADWDPRRLRGAAERIDYTAPIVGAIEFEEGLRLRVVPGALTPRLEHRLLQIADRDGSSFTLSAEKVRKAAKWWSWDALHAFLLGAARTKPGPDLAVTLKGWAGVLPPAALTSVTMLAAPSAWWLDQVMLIPDVKALILQRLSPTLAIVAGENRERLDAALAAIGVDTGEGVSLKEVLQTAAKADSEAGETLLIGPPRKRRALIEQAIAERRRMSIAMLPYGGRLVTTSLNPLRVEGEGAGAYLVAKVDGLRYEQHYALNRISGVRMLDESTKK